MPPTLVRVGAELPEPDEVLDGLLPLLDGGRDVLDEAVEVADERLGDGAVPRARRQLPHRGDHRLLRVLLAKGDALFEGVQRGGGGAAAAVSGEGGSRRASGHGQRPGLGEGGGHRLRGDSGVRAAAEAGPRVV